MIRPRPLFTWVDVEQEFRERRARNEWPSALLRVSAYHDAVVLYLKEGTDKSAVLTTIQQWFGEMLQVDKGILLKAVPGKERVLPVELETAAESKLGHLFRPSFERVAFLPDNAQVPLPPELPAQSPPIVCFYSYKGGVGRTVHLLAVLKALSERTPPAEVLLVDADFEAPGISLLAAAEKFGEPAISLVDFLALAHSAASDTSKDEATDVFELIALYLRSKPLQVSMEGRPVEHFFLPTFREQNQALRLEIRPEHLTQAPGAGWCIAELLARLGSLLRVQAVLVDLRAGLSELSSPLLFDRRVYRAIVSTMSVQSLSGNALVLQQLGKLAESQRKDLSDPSIIVTLLTPEQLGSSALNHAEEELLSRYPDTFAPDEVSPPRLRVDETLFAQELLVLESLSDLMDRLAGTDVAKKMTALADDWIPHSKPGLQPEPASPSGELDKARAKLGALAKTLEYAESGEGEKFLTTRQLRALAQRFQVESPVAVVIGAKGSGKTYTFLQIIRERTWGGFVANTLRLTQKEQWDNVLPLLQPGNVQAAARQLIAGCNASTKDALGVKSLALQTSIRDRISSELVEPGKDESSWRKHWFTLMSMSLGLQAADSSDVEPVIEFLRNRRHRLVFVIDGLEEIFPEIITSRTQQVALRALLQQVPTRLLEIADCPLGLVIFVRADLVNAAIGQNLGQFMRLYEPYALRWDPEQALRLVVWLCNEAGALAAPLPKTPEMLTADEAGELLYSIWGRKLGADDSREARTSEYVISALSDFRGQIQARDLVRLIRYAAEFSASASIWQDRLLAPSAIRKAVQPCSREKINEIEQEIHDLKRVFDKLRSHPDVRIPFTVADFDLTSQEVDLLERSGVILQDEREYYMPEIFRLGFGFQLAGRARPRVLTLAKRAQAMRGGSLS